MRQCVAVMLLAVVTFAAWSQSTVRFANWEFEPSEILEKADESAAALVYRVPPAMGLGAATLTFYAPQRYKGALAPWFDAEWKRLITGKKIEEVLGVEETENADGVNGLAREAALVGGGMLYVTAWNPAGAVNLMVLETSNETATMVGSSAVMMMTLSMTVYPLDDAPSVASSAGAPGGPGSSGSPGSGAPQGPGGGPSPLGPDPYTSIDWDGPDVVVRSLFDSRSIEVEEDLDEFSRLNRGLVGSVRPQPVDFLTAISRARGLLRSSDPDRLLSALGAEKALATAGAAQATAGGLLASAREGESLAVLLAAQQKWPRDADILAALAAILLYHSQANEALAILEELDRRGTLPAAAWGIAPRSMLDYNRGYALMLLGRAGDARALIAPIVDREPNLSEAALTLALLGGSGSRRELFVKGMWRHREARMDADFNSTEKPKDPYKDAEAVMLDVTGYLDLSGGTPGVLPYVPGLVSFDLAPEYAKWAPRTANAAAEQAGALIAPRDAKLDQWRSQTPLGAHRTRMEDLYWLFSEANSGLPAIRELMKERDEASQELGDAMDISMAELERAARRKDFIECAVQLDLSRRMLTRHRPYVDKLEQAVRRLHKVRHQYQTGLAAYVGDPLLREVIALDVQIDSLLSFADIVGDHMSLYLLAPALECPPPPPPFPPADRVGSGDPAECSDEQARYSVSVDVKVVGMELNCREASIELTIPLLGPFGGVSMELGVNTKGEMTLFAAAKGDAQVGTFKSGFYTKFDGNGINDIGYKTNAKVSAGVGLKANYLVGESTQFSLVPSPAEPRVDTLKEYGVK